MREPCTKNLGKILAGATKFKFRYRSILKLFRAELTAYGVRGNTNGPILAAIMVALSFHPPAAMAVAGMRVCPA